VERDGEITSEELDELLDHADTVDVEPLAGPTEMRLYVPVDADTLHELQQRAADAGTDVAAAAAEALRAGARSA
jgi:hypothetical protein